MIYSLKKLCALKVIECQLPRTELPKMIKNYLDNDIKQCCNGYKIDGWKVLYSVSRGSFFDRLAKREKTFCAITSSNALRDITPLPARYGHADCLWKMKREGFHFDAFPAF